MVLVALVHAYANCATLVQRALIHELELVAFALFFAVTLAQNKIKFWRVFSWVQKEISAELLAADQALFSFSEYERDERQSAPTC